MAPSTSIVLCRYRYDPLDRLASTQPAAQDNALRFYRKNRLVTQVQGAIRHTFFGHDDQLLAQQQHSGKSTQTSLLATDQQGSVLHGVDGTGIESRAYNPYGHHPAESGLSCLMGFNGEQRDPVTGHYLLGNGYRAFNTVLMRFNSPDSLSPFDKGGLNAYAYCLGDPVNFEDRTGHIAFANLMKVRPAIFLARHQSRHLKILNRSHMKLNLRQKSSALSSLLDTPSDPVRTQTAHYKAVQPGFGEGRIAGDYYKVPDERIEAINQAMLISHKFKKALYLQHQAVVSVSSGLKSPARATLTRREAAVLKIKLDARAYTAAFKEKFKDIRNPS